MYGYGYDGAEQLLSAVKTSGTGAALDTYAYHYDPAGNRLGQQMAVSGTTFVTSSAYNDLNQVTNVSGTSGLLLAVSGSLSEPGTVAMAGTVCIHRYEPEFHDLGAGGHGLQQHPNHRHRLGHQCRPDHWNSGL